MVGRWPHHGVDGVMRLHIPLEVIAVDDIPYLLKRGDSDVFIPKEGIRATSEEFE